MASIVALSPTNMTPAPIVIKEEVDEADDVQDTTAELNKRINDDDNISELEHLRKLFIGGLAPYTAEDGLRAFYGKWGKVVDAVVMRDPVSKRSRGFGFITFTNSGGVDKAQENRPHIIDGKTVDAKRALPRPERESREIKISVKKLFVGGLKDNHDEECLYEYFSQFGKVVSVKILTDKTTGKRRGFAFIEFDDYDAVDKAILQKSHSIKYVVVDVKKSVYQEQKKQAGINGNATDNSKRIYHSKTSMHNKAGGGPPPPNYQPPPPQAMQPYQQAPPMHTPPAQNYNYWGPPPPQAMPPQYGGYQQPPPPQMNGWGYPPAPNGGWNAGPPPPPAGPPAAAWQPQPNQWGPPPPGPPLPGPPRAAAPPPNANWNMPPVAPPIPPPPGAPNNMPPQQQQPPPNFGTGYQQNYGGGPAKHNMNSNRMNPYNAPPNNYGHNGQQRVGGHGGGYGNAGPGNPHPPGAVPPVNNGPPGAVPNPLSNSGGGNAQNGNKYRR